MTRDRDLGPGKSDATEPNTAARRAGDVTTPHTVVKETTSAGKTSTQISTSADTSRWKPPPDTAGGRNTPGFVGGSVPEMLRSMEVFSDLERESIDRLAEHIEQVRFEGGTKVIQRGDPGDCMYVLASGEVEIPVQARGRGAFSVTLGPGQIFGEMALLTGEPRFTDVLARTDCLCLKLDKDAVYDLIGVEPGVARLLTTILGKRLVESGQIDQVGKYRLVGELGSGGMSTVYEGLHPSLERPVAIKMLSHELVCRPHFIDQFRREARILATLSHPNIVEVLDTEEAYATLFIIMEKLSGVNLERFIANQGKCEADQARDILRQVASALHFAHSRGVVHRDIKPSNIMITPEGRVKLTDFGIAVHREGESSMDDEAEEDEEITDSVTGTPAYMAPEQILGQALDGRSDIYALGIVGYKMLAGKTPFRGSDKSVLVQQVQLDLPDIRRLCPDVPEDLAQLVSRATAKDPEDRFQSAAEILELIGAASESFSSSTLSVSTLTLLYPPLAAARRRGVARGLPPAGGSDPRPARAVTPLRTV